MTPPLSARIRYVSPSPTLAVDAKARALRAQGRDVISFGAGEPDFATPEHVQEAACRAATDPANHGYTAAAGLPELREAIAARTAERWGETVAPAGVTVTNGGKHGIYATFQTLLDVGSEVIVPTPIWSTFQEAIRLAGGVPVEVSTNPQRGHRWDVERVEDAITSRTAAILLVSPSNPTGAVWLDDDLRAIAALAEQHDLWVLSDEIYDQLAYGMEWAPSIAVADPAVRERLVILNGVSKTYAMTGWRVGWVTAPPDVSNALASLQSQMTSNVSNVAQRAALAALTGPQDSVAEMKQAFDRRRQLITELLAAVPGVDAPLPEGAFYSFPDLRGLAARTGVRTTLELADHLLDAADVAIVPGEAFGLAGSARLSFALGDTDIKRGIERVRAFAEDIAGGAAESSTLVSTGSAEERNRNWR